MHGYRVVLADHQNYYPDISFVVDELRSITSVIRNFHFFVAEKWKIASDIRRRYPVCKISWNTGMETNPWLWKREIVKNDH